MFPPQEASDDLDKCFQRISMTSECYDKIMVLPRRRYFKKLNFRPHTPEVKPRRKEMRLTFDDSKKPSSSTFGIFPAAVPLFETQLPAQYPLLVPQGSFSTFSHYFPPPSIPVIDCDGIPRSSDGTAEMTIPKPLSFFTHYYQGSSSTESLDDEDLVRMKGPSRLIGFLVTIAMSDRSSRALRWTGNGLEFILVDRDLVAKMWGNRKHNTKDMDYLKLSRAIREKYEKKNETGAVVKPGKLKKGSKIYSYVFTEHAHPDLEKHTDKTISEIVAYAKDAGKKYKDSDQPDLIPGMDE